MTKAFLPYGRQEIDDEDIAAVVETLRGPMITQGPAIARFEDAFADYVGARHAVAFSSGTAALHGAVWAGGVEAGDEVITSPLTFAASANCALYVGARPRFVDVSPDTWNLDVEAAARAAGPKTKAVIAVSLAGLPVDLGPLQALRDEAVIIEDACHAAGGSRDGVMVGGPGGADMTCFSFHPVKSLTTGEGGMVTTEDDDLAQRLRVFRTHGITKEGVSPSETEGAWYYEMQELGFNYRITDIQCALGLSQLGRLDGWVDRRNEIAARYDELLADDNRVAVPPSAPAGSRHGRHLYVVRVLAGAEARLAAFEALQADGIGVQVHYIPVYRLPYYRDRLGYPQDECPNAETYYAQAISLPMFPSMDEADVERVVEGLQEALS